MDNSEHHLLEIQRTQLITTLLQDNERLQLHLEKMNTRLLDILDKAVARQGLLFRQPTC
jgi:hypothetical protein